MWGEESHLQNEREKLFSLGTDITVDSMCENICLEP
jgi:hypothetical protein